MRCLLLAAAILLSAVTARAQGWGDLNALVMPHLSRSGGAESFVWLPDSPDPSSATRALAVVYEYIEGSAGSVSLAAGVFVRQGTAWAYAGAVRGLFGGQPSDPTFYPTHMELTTITLGPNEPRCCPSVPARWRIDFASLTAQRLN